MLNQRQILCGTTGATVAFFLAPFVGLLFVPVLYTAWFATVLIVVHAATAPVVWASAYLLFTAGTSVFAYRRRHEVSLAQNWTFTIVTLLTTTVAAWAFFPLALLH